MTQPARTPSASGRRLTSSAVAALAVAAVLGIVGVVALVLGLRGAAAHTGSSSTPGTSGLPPSAAGPAVPGASRTAGAADHPAGRQVRPKPTGPTAAASTVRRLTASAPTALEIPSIGVRSRTFVPLTLQRDGTISVPGTAQEIGLYADGPTPGELGPSVLAAHVDTPDGVPGIFADLKRVRAGDVVRISRGDGTRVTFTVDRVSAYRKTAFPTELVYKSDFRRAEIRLVTCGGPTDSRNEYRDNVIVFGHLSRVD